MTTPINPTSLAMPSGRLAPGPRPVMSLTERYLAARFGRRELSNEEERDFERRVKSLRKERPVEERAA